MNKKRQIELNYKSLSIHFKRQTSEISHEKIWIWIWKGKLLREIEYLLIAAQNNTIRTNLVKAKIDKTPKNSRCTLCGDRDETINHRSEWSKLAPREYKTRHDRMGKVIHWFVCLLLNGMHNQNPSLKMRSQSSLGFWDTNESLILDQTTASIDSQRKKKKKKKKKKTCRIVDFRLTPKVKLEESEKRYKYHDLAWKLKKLWNMRVTVIPIVVGVLGIVTKRLVQGLEDLEIRQWGDTIQTTAFVDRPEH